MRISELEDLIQERKRLLKGMRAVIAAAYPAQPDATATVRELCEQIGTLHDAFASAEKRAEDAERKLAALTEAGNDVARSVVNEMLDEALRDAATGAERHDRKVRAKELRRMAEQALAADNDCPFYGEKAHDANRWLRDEADRIERGEA